jgi:hypothetical protein
VECLDEETVLAFCGGKLAAEARARVEEHLGACDECRALVSAIARTSMVEPPAADMAMAPTTPAPGVDGKGPVTAPVAAGDVLGGKFEVERVLGAGGMGVVVAARHMQLEQRVALKFLLPAACEVPGAVSRFLREGKAAARITSEHVAKVVDTGVLDGGAPYLVMEYLEGQDLGAVAKQRGKIAPTDAVEYVLQACEAIVEAHALGIVHRDLKPANLFLSRRKDGSPLVKVLDFGISKVEGGSRPDLTSATTLMGSPRYMSPEQMLSAKDVDARTDVWALGVILFELVTGRPVWEADTVQGLCALITSEPAPKLRTLVPDVPAVLEDVVMRCLAKKRDDRLASVAELALALEPIAPASAKTSIERVLRVAGHERPAVAAEPGAAKTPGNASSRVWLALGLAAGAIAIGALVWMGQGTTEITPVNEATATAVAPAPAAASASATASASAPAPAPAPASASASASASALSSASPSVPASAAPIAAGHRVVVVTTHAASSASSAAVAPASAAAPGPAPSSRALTDRK